MRPEVQNLLKKVTGYNVNKVFKVRFEQSEAPSYKLVTEDELKEVNSLMCNEFRLLFYLKRDDSHLVDTTKRDEYPFQLKKEADVRAETMLQMPPVLKARDESVRLISQDPEIEMFDSGGSKYVFTDITFGISNRVRVCFTCFRICLVKIYNQ